MSALQPVMGVLRQHYGVIGVRPDEDAALTVDQIRKLVDERVLERVIDGAYRLTSHPLNELARCAAVCLSRPSLVIAGPTAARLWALRRAPRGGVIHVIGPSGSQPCRAPWVNTYRTDAIDPLDIESRSDGIRLTSARRTMLDMYRYLPHADVLSMIEDGLNRQLFTLDDLMDVAMPLVSLGRPAVGKFIKLIESRGSGAAAESGWEERVFQALRRRVTGLVRQFPVVLDGYGPARFDLAVPSLNWAIEIDVHPSHLDRDGVARDKRRDRASSRAGWRVTRLDETDLRGRFRATMDELERIAHRLANGPTAA